VAIRRSRIEAPLISVGDDVHHLVHAISGTRSH
jgi:hypothetical protein